MEGVVAVLALDTVIGYDMVIPPTVLGEATDKDGNALYDVRVCGLDTSPVRVLAGYSIVPDVGAEILAESDTVIIPGTRLRGARHEGTLPAAVAEARAAVGGATTPRRGPPGEAGGGPPTGGAGEPQRGGAPRARTGRAVPGPATAARPGARERQAPQGPAPGRPAQCSQPGTNQTTWSPG